MADEKSWHITRNDGGESSLRRRSGVSQGRTEEMIGSRLGRRRGDIAPLVRRREMRLITGLAAPEPRVGGTVARTGSAVERTTVSGGSVVRGAETWAQDARASEGGEPQQHKEHPTQQPQRLDPSGVRAIAEHAFDALGKPDRVYGMDTDGDGRMDRFQSGWAIDTSGDGFADAALVDVSGDGRPDTLAPAVDTVGDGVADSALVDADGDGRLDTLAVRLSKTVASPRSRRAVGRGVPVSREWRPGMHDVGSVGRASVGFEDWPRGGGDDHINLRPDDTNAAPLLVAVTDVEGHGRRRRRRQGGTRWWWRRGGDHGGEGKRDLKSRLAALRWWLANTMDPCVITHLLLTLLLTTLVMNVSWMHNWTLQAQRKAFAHIFTPESVVNIDRLNATVVALASAYSGSVNISLNHAMPTAASLPVIAEYQEAPGMAGNVSTTTSTFGTSSGHVWQGGVGLGKQKPMSRWRRQGTLDPADPLGVYESLGCGSYDEFLTGILNFDATIGMRAWRWIDAATPPVCYLWDVHVRLSFDEVSSIRVSAHADTYGLCPGTSAPWTRMGWLTVAVLSTDCVAMTLDVLAWHSSRRAKRRGNGGDSAASPPPRSRMAFNLIAMTMHLSTMTGCALALANPALAHSVARDWSLVLLGTSTLLSWTYIVRFLRRRPEFSILTLTFESSVGDAWGVALSCAPVMVGACMYGIAVLCPETPTFSDFPSTLSVLTALMIGDSVLPMLDVAKASGLWSQLYIFAWVLFSIAVLFRLLTAVYILKYHNAKVEIMYNKAQERAKLERAASAPGNG